MGITVIGDVLLDEDATGTSTRDCPDSPGAPVLELSSRRYRAGGAGLVAKMLAADGHRVTLVTALGDDAAGDVLRAELRGIDVVACDAGAPTPVKTRLRRGSEIICRIDEGCERPPLPLVTPAMLDAVARASGIVVADYGRRLLEHPELREAVDRRGRAVPVVWDPHPLGSDPVEAARLVTPNLQEAAGETSLPEDPRCAGEAAALLRDRMGCAAVAVTLGQRGAVVATAAAEPRYMRTDPVEADDPCGAGDRFSASAAAALERGADIVTAVTEAVAAARAYLERGGIAAFGTEARDGRPRSRAVEPGSDVRPVDTMDAAQDPIAFARGVAESGGRVVAAGGCFDLLHAGHIRTLQSARALGDCLIVVMNSDESVRRLKGPERPIMGEHHRTEMLLALTCVDGVVVFEEDGPEAALEQLRPDLWVKGGDYRVDDLPETRLLESWGGSAIALPYQLGHSTTRLAEALARVG